MNGGPPTATVETPRLVGQPANPSDFAALRTLHADPAVMRTLSATGRPRPEGVSRAWIRTAGEHWDEHGFGIWFFRARDTADFVGYCGLRRYAVEGQAETELLYAVRSELWRRGYAAEMTDAVLAYARTHVDTRSLVAFTLEKNAASQAVMRRAGFAYEKDIVHAGLPHVLYRLALGQADR